MENSDSDARDVNQTHKQYEYFSRGNDYFKNLKAKDKKLNKFNAHDCLSKYKYYSLLPLHIFKSNTKTCVINYN